MVNDWVEQVSCFINKLLFIDLLCTVKIVEEGLEKHGKPIMFFLMAKTITKSVYMTIH